MEQYLIERLISGCESSTIKSYLVKNASRINYSNNNGRASVTLPLELNNIYELKYVREIEQLFLNQLNLKEVHITLNPYGHKKDYLDDYQKFTRTTAIYPTHQALNYLTMGLVSEAGEVAGVVKKWVRGDMTTATMHDRLSSELADILWYWVRLFDETGLDFHQAIKDNIAKLEQRKQNNTIKGDGDER